MDEIVFSKNTVEFVTVGVEYCSFIERAPSSAKSAFTDTAVKILPLLYLKAVLLDPEENELTGLPEKFVTEEIYEYVRGAVERLLGEGDTYLETFHDDMEFSEEPVAASISEDLADVYQNIKDFVSVYSLGNPETMREALTECRQNFVSYWGQKLVNALGALHRLRFSSVQEDASEEEENLSPESSQDNWLFEQRQESWKEETSGDEWDKWNE